MMTPLFYKSRTLKEAEIEGRAVAECGRFYEDKPREYSEEMQQAWSRGWDSYFKAVRKFQLDSKQERTPKCL